MNFEVITHLEKKRWIDAHKNNGNFFSSSWTMAQYTLSTGDSPLLLLIHEEGRSEVLPLVKKSTQTGENHISSPIGFSGPGKNLDSKTILSALKEFANLHGYYTAYICTHPLGQNFDFEEKDSGTLFVLSLSDKLEDIERGFSKSVSQKIKYARRSGVKSSFEKNTEVKDSFLKLYSDQHHGNVSGPYMLSKESVDYLFDSKETLVVSSRLPEGGIEAVSVFGLGKECADYFLSTSDYACKDLQAWNIYFAINKLKELGVKSLNLGGGIHNEDGLHHFKRRFGGRACPKSVLTVVLDREGYTNSAESVEMVNTNMFPEYI